MRMQLKKLPFVKIALLGCVVFFFAHGLKTFFFSSKPTALPPPKVVVQKPKSLKITSYISQTGTMVAYNSVDLVARIEGYLDAVKFTDGTFIKKGKELFVIEPKPYLEKLKAAEATVVAQKAAYTYNMSEYARQKTMYKQNATSLNNVEKWGAQAEEIKAEIDKAIADAEVAAINYSYTHVFAPFDGRIGRHLVDPGNLVGNGKATNLATIQQIDPIYVYFNLNELDLIAIRDAARAHGFKPSEINKIPVYVGLQNESNFPHEGKLDFVNTGLNASTGTIEFRALLSNKDVDLLPGLFVRVRIPIAKPKAQLTVPNTAIQYDQIGAYVMIVNTQNIVVIKRIVIGACENGVCAVIKGLLGDDNVIVSGSQNATPGHLVTLTQLENPST